LFLTAAASFSLPKGRTAGFECRLHLQKMPQGGGPKLKALSLRRDASSRPAVYNLPGQLRPVFRQYAFHPFALRRHHQSRANGQPDQAAGGNASHGG